jgi:hypothetical protein
MVDILQKAGAWAVSPVGPTLRFETREGETGLVDALRASGYEVNHISQGERCGAFGVGEVKDQDGKVVQTYPVSQIVKTDIYNVAIFKSEPRMALEQKRPWRIAVAPCPEVSPLTLFSS